MPLILGIQMHALYTVAGVLIGKYVDNYRNGYLAERDAAFRHYIQLHPEDFPDFCKCLCLGVIIIMCFFSSSKEVFRSLRRLVSTSLKLLFLNSLVNKFLIQFMSFEFFCCKLKLVGLTEAKKWFHAVTRSCYDFLSVCWNLC